jgi:3'-phosphoadenosine 5'-phosphosulfate sulfotransferase (PAPS reductase)/FAD synthetase
MQEFFNFGYPALQLEAAPVDVRAARVIAAVSAGRDSAAASMLLTKNGIAHERLFYDTAWEDERTYAYLRGPLQAALGPITEIRAAMGFEELVLKKGLFPSRVMRFCTEELKVLPVLEYIRSLAESETREIVNVVGIRRGESKKRSTMAEWEWSDTFDCWIWRPLVAWHIADVMAIHRDLAIEVNPLYPLGASRVGCFPCIHARKSELALVAREAPERIDLIDRLEKRLNAEGRARAEASGEPFVERSMFSYHGGDSKHYPLPIRDAVAWAQSNRGEWQPEGDDGCARFGFCAVDPEQEPDDPDRPRLL